MRSAGEHKSLAGFVSKPAAFPARVSLTAMGKRQGRIIMRTSELQLLDQD